MNLSIEDIIKLHEGFSKYPISDSYGTIQIGYGYNLSINGLPKDICDELLRRKIFEIIIQLRDKIPFWDKVDIVRQQVLIDMSYQLGVNGLLGFRKMLKFLELGVKTGKQGYYYNAGMEIIDSKYAKQTRKRALECSEAMQNGKWNYLKNRYRR